LVDAAIAGPVADENKQKLAQEIENGTDHYLHNSIGSFSGRVSPDDSSATHLIRRANLLQAHSREITHQYGRAAHFYKRADSEEFKDKITEMEEKSQTETYTEPSEEEQWERAKQVHESIKSFLEDVQGDQILQVDPVATAQKIVEGYKS
jgi:hypothetical protein